MKRYDIEVQIVREEGIESVIAEMVTVSDLQAWALKHKATVEGMPHAEGCDAICCGKCGAEFHVGLPYRNHDYYAAR